MDFFSRLEDVRSRWNVLEHSFYTRWSAGELTAEELASYSGQYRHAVVALADAAESAAATAAPELRAALTAHAAEERSHVALWDRFAVAAGGDPDRRRNRRDRARAPRHGPATDRDNLASLVALYAIESGQPAISTDQARRPARALRPHRAPMAPRTSSCTPSSTSSTPRRSAR